MPPTSKGVVDAEVEPVHLRAPDKLGGTFDGVGEPQRRHEQRHRRAVDQWPEHGPLDGEAERDHDREGDEQRKREGDAAFDEADKGERCEQHHRPLREVQHARRLVDQHETYGDKRIHDAREQAADQHFDDEEEIIVAHQMSSPFSPSAVPI